MADVPVPVRTFTVDQLPVDVFASNDAMSEFVAHYVQSILIEAVSRQGSAAAILATGNSQLRFLKRLVELGGIDWSRITLFHMDEYLGLPAEHPAGFRRYMKDRVESLVHPRAFHYLAGDAELPEVECDRYTALLRAQAIDLCCLGVGENGHLAFNDPPVARFDDTAWVKLVKLDDVCKMQQVKEGHFPSLAAVPAYALTLTIPALMSARNVVCVAPEKRKSVPIRNALKGPISTVCPASILRRQAHARLLLDVDSAVLL
jgi:glucosamine-6-phosphate deaminase